MTKKERVIAAFRGQETDHVPVCFWKHVPPEQWDDDKFIKAQKKFFKETDVDFMKLSADKFFGWPHPVLQNLQTSEDLYRMTSLGLDHPHIRGQIERTRKLVKELNGECCSLYLVFCPLSYLRLEVGYDKMMEMMRQDPEAMKFACKIIGEDVKVLIRGLIEEAGCDGIMYSVQNGEVNRFTYEEYRDWVTPSDKDVLDYANRICDMVASHFCGWEGVGNRLEVWKDYKSQVVSWARFVEKLEVKDAQKFFGCTVWGGFNNVPGTLLYNGTKEEIQAETRRLIGEGTKRGYIIGADCSIHDDLPLERIKWVVETARSI
ncbi:MAG: uroporphyrinogen decarboxylase family protein [Fusicatenibacter sp.]